MTDSFDPYHKLLGIPPDEQPPNLYRLLGLSHKFEEDLEVIENCANRVLASLRQHQSGPHAVVISKVLNEVAHARRTLLNPAKKLAYDEELRSQVAAQADVQPQPVSKPAQYNLRYAFWGLAATLVPCLVGFLLYSYSQLPPRTSVEQQEVSNQEVSGISSGNTLPSMVSGNDDKKSSGNSIEDSTNPKSRTMTSVSAQNGTASEKPRPAINAPAGQSKVNSDNTASAARTSRANSRASHQSKRTKGEILPIDFDVNLLDRIDPAVDTTGGPWVWRDGVLGTTGRGPATLILPFGPIRPGYKITIDLESGDVAQGGIKLSLPVDGQSASLNIDVDSGMGPQSALIVDNLSGSASPVSYPKPLLVGSPIPSSDSKDDARNPVGSDRTVRLTVEVCSASIRLWKGSSLILEWQGDPRRLSRDDDFRGLPRNQVVLHSVSGPVSIRSLIWAKSHDSTIPAVPAQVNSKALFALLDPIRDTQRLQWTFTKERIVSPEAVGGRLQVPVIVPAEYDLSVGIEAADLESGCVIGLPSSRGVLECLLSSSHVSVVGYEGRKGSGAVLEAQKAVRIDFQIRNAGLQVLKEGVARFSIDFNNPSTTKVKRSEYELPWLLADERSRIFFGSTESAFAIVGLGLAANTDNTIASTFEVQQLSAPFRGPQGRLTDSTSEPDSSTSSPVIPLAPRPSASELASALDKIKLQLKSDYAKAKRPLEKAALAERLKSMASGEPAGTPTRFVLLDQARDHFANAGDPVSALGAADGLAKSFEIEEFRVKSDTVKILVKSTREPERVKLLMDEIFKCARKAIDAEKFGLATELAAHGTTLSQKMKTRVMVEEFSELKKESTTLLEQFTKAEKARKELLGTPESPTANLILGEYLCLVRKDWAAGLSALVKSNEATLKLLSEKDLKAPIDVQRRLELAREWLKFSQTGTAHSNALFADRAVYWLNLAFQQTTGINQDVIREDLKRAIAVRDWNQPYIGLLEKLTKSMERENFVLSPLVGRGTSRATEFKNVLTEPALLVGMEFVLRASSVNQDNERVPLQTVEFTRPIFLTVGGIVEGESRSNARAERNLETERLVQLNAPAGYAIAGFRGEVGSSLFKIALLYRKIAKGGLDPDRSIWSDEIGSGYPFAGNQQTGGFDSLTIPIVGIHGKAQEAGGSPVGRVVQFGFMMAQP